MRKRLPTIVVLLNLLVFGLRIPAFASEYCECIEKCTDYFTGSCCCEWTVGHYPTDNLTEYLILDAYRLSSAMEQSYKSNDGVLSPFWSAWSDSAFDRAVLMKEYEGNAFHFRQKSSSNISRMEAFAAYGDYGLYLCFVVTDDRYQDTSNSGWGERWMYDAVDFCIDRYSTTTHQSSSNIFPNLNSGRIPVDMVQYQQAFGSDHAPDVLSRNSVVDTGSQPKMVYERNISSSELKSRFGVTRDIVILDQQRRAQEWFLPYNQIGNNGGISFPLPDSDRFGRTAFCFGYNDVDYPTQESSYDPLRWRNASGPFKKVRKYNSDIANEDYDHVPAEPWGDIRFVAEKVEVKYTGHRRIVQESFSGIPADRFDLRGRKIPQSELNPSNGAVLLRRKLPNGRVLVERRIHGL